MSDKTTSIVLVDDDIDFLELLRGLLEKNGYNPICFSNREEALAHMALHKPDLVMTDLMMESLNSGFLFSRWIKAVPEFQDIPVIIVTAASSRLGFDFRPETANDLDAMSADAFFEKPVNPSKLLAKIKEIFKNAPAKP